MLFGEEVTVVVWGGTTTTVHVSTFPQSLGVKVPGTGLTLLGGDVTVVVWGGTTTTVHVSTFPHSVGVYVPGAE